MLFSRMKIWVRTLGYRDADQVFLEGVHPMTYAQYSATVLLKRLLGGHPDFTPGG